MPQLHPVGIVGTGSYQPERILKNDDFKQWVDTSDEWITQRTGIKERRFAREDQPTSDLAYHAAIKALDVAGWDPKELDFVIVGTATPDALFPTTANALHDRLGCRPDCGSVDMVSACSSFMVGTCFGAPLIQAGHADKVLVIGAEKLSHILDLYDRNSCVLFGDGAGAACLTRVEEDGPARLLAFRWGTQYNYEALHLPDSGSREYHVSRGPGATGNFRRIVLNGRAIYKFAVDTLHGEVRRILEENGYTPDDLDVLVPHQVNIRIIDSGLQKLGVPKEKVVLNLERYGNTSSASVPMALDEAVQTGRFKKGDLVVCIAFGGGLTWGVNLIRW